MSVLRSPRVWVPPALTGATLARGMDARVSRRTAMVAATSAVLALAFAIQLLSWRHNGSTALSDLPRVFNRTRVGTGGFPYIDRMIEYPVGAGILLYLAAVIAPSAIGIFVVTALASSALCIAITLHLERRFGSRAWRWAIGSPIALFAFQNWDVFAIAAMLAALLALEAGRDRITGGWLGIGAAIKVFPIALAPPFVALRWARGDRRGAVRLAVGALAVLACVNLPVLLANPSGWWWPFSFQGHRSATWGSAWHYVFDLLHIGGSGTANAVSLVALICGIGWLTRRTLRRDIAPAAVAGAAVAMFILANKVYSPTYDLWLVPFFVLLPLSRRLWVTFCAVDLAVYVTVYGYFHGLDSADFVRAVLPFFVLARTVILARVIVAAIRAPRLRHPVQPGDNQAHRRWGSMVPTEGLANGSEYGPKLTSP
jgi:uncharacterized membrane protein